MLFPCRALASLLVNAMLFPLVEASSFCCSSGVTLLGSSMAADVLFVVELVGDGVGNEILPGRYDTPSQEVSIDRPARVTNLCSLTCCISHLLHYMYSSAYGEVEAANRL